MLACEEWIEFKLKRKIVICGNIFTPAFYVNLELIL